MHPGRTPETASERQSAIPRISASTLLASSREIILVHKEQEYRLRITSNDKLLLTK
jgi:hemin uptake protein HemP